MLTKQVAFSNDFKKFGTPVNVFAAQWKKPVDEVTLIMILFKEFEAYVSLLKFATSIFCRTGS